MLSSRSAGAAVAFVLLSTPVAGFLLRPDQALEAPTPRASKPALATPPPRTSRPVRLVIDPTRLAAARSSARRFGREYAVLIAGRITAREIGDAVPKLVREPRRRTPSVMPAQQRLQPKLRRVAAEPAAAIVPAVATRQNASSPPYELAFFRERRWLVTRLLDA